MEITVRREALSEAFSIAQGIATTRSTRPVLQNALLTVSGDQTIVTATDMEIGLIWNIAPENCEIAQDGQALLPAARMAQIVRSIEAEKVTLKREDSKCVVSGGNSVFEVMTENVEDFPPVPPFPEEKVLEIEAERFNAMTRKTLFAAARESTRYALNGIRMEVADSQIEMVATDGRRMALVKEKVAKQAKMPEAIVPQKALAQVEKLKAAEGENVRVVTKERQIFFGTAQGTVVSRLVEGHFPPYRDVVPKDCTRKAKASRLTLLSALRQAAIMTSEDSKSVLMAFAGNELTVTGRSPDEGRGEARIQVEYEGGPLEIRFNPHFLIDALSASEAEEITLEMKDAGSPAAMKDGTGFLYVVMPINIV